MRLIIVRHGQTEANEKRICQGQTDGALCPKGFWQVTKTALYLQHQNIDVCYSSDLNRALQTTEKIMEYHHNTPIKTDKRIRERYFGSFQGKFFPEKIDKNSFPPETETPQEVASRVKEFFSHIQKEHPTQTILLVSHGFTIRIMIAIFNNIDADDIERIEDIKNASISSIIIDNGDFTIEFLNDISHLK